MCGPATAVVKPKIGTVLERKLVKENVNYRTVIKEHKRYSPDIAKNKTFEGPTLVYVTPWNSHGYDAAKLFNGKFNYVSPVWYQIKFERASSKFTLIGKHDVDQGWISEVRNSSTIVPEIVPRFIFQSWMLEDYQHLFNDPSLTSQLITLLVRECVRENYDGLVLEHSYVLNNQMSPLLISLANQLHELNKKIILVIPADKGYREGQHTLTSSVFVWLAEYIDHFSLMTYDFSSPQRPGPTAPLSWMTQNVLRLLPPDHRTSSNNLGHKILMGLNFYGYEYWKPQNAEAIIGPRYLKLLAAYKPTISWQQAHHEHFFTYKRTPEEERLVYYPTLKSLYDRISLARDLGVGISVWEIGQGLDYFFDLL
jgi:chitinase domain-containing protein 1